jgi:hypothetical protein
MTYHQVCNKSNKIKISDILSNMLHDKYHLQLNNWWLPLQRRHMPVYAGSDGETN